MYVFDTHTFLDVDGRTQETKGRVRVQEKPYWVGTIRIYCENWFQCRSGNERCRCCKSWVFWNRQERIALDAWPWGMSGLFLFFFCFFCLKESFIQPSWKLTRQACWDTQKIWSYELHGSNRAVHELLIQVWWFPLLCWCRKKINWVSKHQMAGVSSQS